LTQAAATGRALQGFERQAAAYGEDPVSDEEVEEARVGDVGGRRQKKAVRKALASKAAQDELDELRAERDDLESQLRELERARSESFE
jgi:hypothetical protein